MTLPSIDTMYNALVNRDPAFEGLFIVGVKTTGIFCRPTCRARKPKKENTEYFHDVQSAAKQGYRPCKICSPLEKAGSLPDWLAPVFSQMDDHPAVKIKDGDLKLMQIDPSRVRRWFNKNYQMTFQQYQRHLLVNHALAGLEMGNDVTQVAFKHGYESLSGFGHTIKKTMGVSPKQAKKMEVIITSRVLTPLGPMIAATTSKGICLLEFADRPTLSRQISGLEKGLGAKVLPGSSPILLQLQKQLVEYFDEGRKQFELPLDPIGTAFQQKVWKVLANIPYGTTRSYLQQAKLINNEKGVRAVASANGANRIAIVYPCHRVIGSDGSPTGYAGGIWRKKWLLEHERSR